MAKKPNAQDGTERNIKASNKRDAALLMRLRRVEQVLREVHPTTWKASKEENIR